MARCKGIKKDGTRCSRSPEENSKFCWQHPSGLDKLQKLLKSNWNTWGKGLAEYLAGTARQTPFSDWYDGMKDMYDRDHFLPPAPRGTVENIRNKWIKERRMEEFFSLLSQTYQADTWENIKETFGEFDGVCANVHLQIPEPLYQGPNLQPEVIKRLDARPRTFNSAFGVYLVREPRGATVMFEYSNHVGKIINISVNYWSLPPRPNDDAD